MKSAPENQIDGDRDTVTLPGLIDIHVHLRDPGQTEKEDFTTGTSAALSGGFTTVFDMPNNAEPITNLKRLDEKLALASKKTVADIGFHYGSLGDNLETFASAAKRCFALKLYLNNTTGGYTLDVDDLKAVYDAWPHDRPVLLHTEEDTIDVAIESLEGLNRPVHVCHMPSRAVLEKIIAAKAKGIPVTCGVTAHHLFLDETDRERLGVYGVMKPPLKSKSDQDFLWNNLDAIDLFESDHAPHTREQKEAGAFGVPNLETTLPLLLKARQEGRITLEQIVDKCFYQPAKLLNLPTDDNTTVEVLMKPYTIDNAQLFTKCGWSPYHGWEVPGRVSRVTIRGKVVFEDGKVQAKPGDGRVIEPLV